MLRGAGIEVLDSRANFLFIPTGEATIGLSAELEKLGIVTRPFPDLGLRITVGSPEQNERWLGALQQVSKT